MPTLAPRDETELKDVIVAAIANRQPFEILGQHSKSGLGRAERPGDAISTAALTGVSMYEPEELVMTAGAGTPLKEVRALLDQQGQEFAFEPFDPSGLYGGEVGAGTLGGMIAVNASGPRRIKAGAARDHLLGFRAVSGRGEVFKSGGRVMKNVTGYDLSKLITGSHGTLAVMSEVTIKVMPKAETERSLVVIGLSEADALAVLRTASGSPHEVSCLAVLPPGLSNPAIPDWGASAAAILRLEGPEVSVTKRRDDLVAMFRPLVATFQTLDEAASKTLWATLRDGEPLSPGGERDTLVWRISIAPTEAASVVAAIKSDGLAVQTHYYDWAGGLVWLSLAEPLADAGSVAIRRAVEASGGHATLMRAPDEIRDAIAVFHPQPGPLAALTARVKDAFDPEKILNRGRMRADL